MRKLVTYLKSRNGTLITDKYEELLKVLSDIYKQYINLQPEFYLHTFSESMIETTKNLENNLRHHHMGFYVGA